MLFPKGQFARLRQLPPGRGGGYLLRQLAAETPGDAFDGTSGPVCLVSAQKECELWDIDTPEDLGRIAAYLEE